MAVVDFVSKDERKSGLKRRPRSAVTRIPNPRLEVVARKKTPKSKLASEADYAGRDFKPWVVNENVKRLFSESAIRNLAVQLRLSYALMLKTKYELVESNGRIAHEDMDELIADLMSAEQLLLEHAQMVSEVTVRLISAACAYKAAGREFKFRDGAK